MVAILVHIPGVPGSIPGYDTKVFLASTLNTFTNSVASTNLQCTPIRRAASISLQYTPIRRAACTSLQCTPNSKDKMAVLRVPTYNVLPIVVLRVPAYNVLPTKGTYRTQVHQLQ